MQKAESQHGKVQSQPSVRQGGSAALESPQGEQIAQLEAMAESSPQVGKLAQLAAMANSNPRMSAQRKAISAIHNSPNVIAQRQQLDSLTEETAQHEEVGAPLQAKVAQREGAPAKPNNTGLPDNLKNGIESLSGMSMDNVRVHYNSSQPAQLNALAYAQGADIHVAPGQEKHLPHEAWHVVQQAQGRVQPTMQMKGGMPVNDDQGLEREADVMGGRAVSGGVAQAAKKSIESDPIDFGVVVQRYYVKNPATGGIRWEEAVPTPRYYKLSTENYDGERGKDKLYIDESQDLKKEEEKEEKKEVIKEKDKEYSLAVDNFEVLQTKIGILTGELTSKKNSDSETSDEEESEVSPDANKQFQKIKLQLEVLGWVLLKGNEGHCYTEVAKHYAVTSVANEGTDKATFTFEDDLESFFYDGHPARGELTKTVYYAPNCELIDLIHEMDHVHQIEEFTKQQKTQLITTWDAYTWGEEKVAQEPGEGIMSVGAEQSRAFQEAHVRKDEAISLLGKSDNAVSEYHNYMLEVIRYIKLKAPLNEIQEIAKRVADHRKDAEKALSELDQENPFIAACESIMPFDTLKEMYRKADGPKYEK